MRSVTFKGLSLGRDDSDALQANWTWALSVGNYSTGGSQAQIVEAYSLRIPLEVELSGPNVHHNICMVALPSLANFGTKDPGDCSTILKAESITELLASVAASNFGTKRSPCGSFASSKIYNILDYESDDSLASSATANFLT
ncbi:hypothetical protein ACJ72_01288 [Emergomyces africanus]|uniref:Uncharacterized protein n=1 Tax=Emergomyces africanus TaxID=1955775 RepID=A0A1B7P5P0_9EURO|nr:hypothetical protein ACJ72_01288 [Emergomyces africanus]